MIRVLKGRQGITQAVPLIKVCVNKAEMRRDAADKTFNDLFRKGFATKYSQLLGKMGFVDVPDSPFSFKGKRHYGIIIAGNETVPVGTDGIEIP